MAATAVALVRVRQHGIDRALEQGNARTAVREALAGADFLDGRRLELNRATTGRGRAGPVANPDGERIGTRRRRSEPAVVTAAHLENHAGLVRLGQVHDRVRGRVREVHIVITSELRRLAARVVTSAATIGGLD